LKKLNIDSYKWSIKHLIKESDTDLFPRPYELTIIQELEQQLLEELENIDVASYRWHEARRFLVPKDNLSYRNATQLHPIDSIVLGAILYEYGSLIESKRQNEDVVFSYRFKPSNDGSMYSNKTAWNDFWQACQRKVSYFDEDDGELVLDDEYEYVVMCDISDFYNQIYLHTIENQLIECGFPNAIQKRISELLKLLNKNNSRGIPIGPHSSHLIAEMSLIPIDNTLNLHEIDYLRYVDDIVFFCRSEKEARKRVLQIAEILDKDQRLTLQRQKTKKMRAGKFFEHTREMLIDEPIYQTENKILDIIKQYTGGNSYTRVSLSIIKDEHLKILNASNIVKLLEDYLTDENFEKLRWIYRRLSQIGIPHAVDFSIENFQRLIPALNDICLYINSCAENYSSDWKSVGGEILDLLEDELVEDNPFYQISLLNLFIHNKELNHFGYLAKIFKNGNEDVKRKILLASINYKSSYSWINQLKEETGRFSEWTLRAYLIATKSMPSDHKKFLHGSIRESLSKTDIMENLILKWAK